MPNPALIEAARLRVAEIESAPRFYGPSIEPCACGAGRHRHSGPTCSGSCRATGCKRYRRDAVDALVEEVLAADTRGLADDLHLADKEHTRKRGLRKTEGTVRVSASDSSSCRRAIQYRERPDPGMILSPSDKRAAFVGSLIHDASMRVRRRLYPWRLFERNVEIPGLGASQYDSYDPITCKVDDTKCTTPDTLVLMADGTERRADAVLVGEHVVAWDAVSDRLTAARVGYSASNGEQSVVTIFVAGGRTLTVTEDHPVLVATRAGYTWREAAQVQAGDRVRLALGWQGRGSDHVRPSLDGAPCQHEGSAPHAARTGGRYCPTHYTGGPALPDAHRPLTEDDAYLLGVLTGDGGLTGWQDTRDAGVTFTSADVEIVERTRKCLAVFDATLTEAGQPYAYRVAFGKSGLRARAFREWLIRHNMLHGAHDKRVPAEVMAGSPGVRAAFAAGLLDTDGTVAPHTAAVTWASVSRALLADMQTLIAHLGAAATLNVARQQYDGREHVSYVLTVKRAADVAVLGSVLSLATPRKRDALAALAGREQDRQGRSHLARVVRVERSGIAETWALTIEGFHTHVTAGIVSHNTAGDWKWDLVTDYGPPASEWRQVLIYGLALVRQGMEVRTVQITYLQRKNGHDERFERPFDISEAEAAVAYLTTIATQIELGIEQPRDEPGPGLSPLCTRYCEFRAHCWGIPQAEAAGRSPRSWTLLGPSPEDERVAEVLALYHAAQKAESGAEKEKKEHKETLGGIKPGEYGDLVLKITEMRRADQKGYIDRLIRWAESDPATRPPLDSIEVPTKMSPMTRIGPVPKAEQARRAKEAAKAAQAVAHAEAEAAARQEETP